MKAWNTILAKAPTSSFFPHASFTISIFLTQPFLADFFRAENEAEHPLRLGAEKVWGGMC